MKRTTFGATQVATRRGLRSPTAARACRNALAPPPAAPVAFAARSATACAFRSATQTARSGAARARSRCASLRWRHRGSFLFRIARGRVLSNAAGWACFAFWAIYRARLTVAYPNPPHPNPSCWCPFSWLGLSWPPPCLLLLCLPPPGRLPAGSRCHRRSELRKGSPVSGGLGLGPWVSGSWVFGNSVSGSPVSGSLVPVNSVSRNAAHGTSGRDTRSPDTRSPDTRSPDTRSRDMSSPGTAKPGIRSPSTRRPDRAAWHSLPVTIESCCLCDAVSERGRPGNKARTAHRWQTLPEERGRPSERTWLEAAAPASGSKERHGPHPSPGISRSGCCSVTSQCAVHSELTQ